jgi:hypothetical protein
MKYKLIAIDMDGTLLNSDNEISERNQSAIREAADKGIKVVLTTGRIYSSALFYAKSLNISTPIISCNGAYIAEHDKSNILYESPISVDSIKDVIELAEKENMHYHFYDDSTFYARELNETVIKYYNWNKKRDEMDRININIIENPFEVVQNEKLNVYKFVFVENDREKLLRFKKKLESIKNIEIASSWINNVEVMNKGVSKGKALEELCKLFGINKGEVVAIGDNENDISMLEFAGLSVAMGNGVEKARKISCVVTDTNDNDGNRKVCISIAYNFFNYIF